MYCSVCVVCVYGVSILSIRDILMLRLSCSPQQACCNNECGYKSRGGLCRSAMHSCDHPEYAEERREEERRAEKYLPNLLVLCAVYSVCRGGVRCTAYSYMCDPPPSSGTVPVTGRSVGTT